VGVGAAAGAAGALAGRRRFAARGRCTFFAGARRFLVTARAAAFFLGAALRALRTVRARFPPAAFAFRRRIRSAMVLLLAESRAHAKRGGCARGGRRRRAPRSLESG
jgi:hypothetical protein